MKNEVPVRTRVFQIAAWVWLAYLLSLAVVDLVIYAGQPNSPLLIYYLVNGLPAVIFLAISYSTWLKIRGQIAALLLILIITITPILANPLFDIHLPPAPLSNLEGMVLRQLPVLFIGLVLVAWNYNLIAMILYSLGTNILEIAVVYGFRYSNPALQSSFYYIVVVRTVCFIVVGIFINQLITLLRAQQESLQAANHQLTHYASTLESLTVSRERNRMSRELHDTVIHTLSGLSVQLETARAYWDVDTDTAKDLLESSLEAARSGLQETRRAIKSLRASPLEDLGLVRAIQELLTTASQRGNLVLDSSLPDHHLFLAPDVEQCIYRITQEAVENVLHHANARNLKVQLNVEEKGVELLIQDDGIGFKPSENMSPGHYGLAGMRERAKIAGGRLTIDSQPQSGTTVQLLIRGMVK